MKAQTMNNENRSTTALLVEYDGTNYFGWQRQAKENSIQQEIETALEKILKRKISIIAAGRTDTGVHSFGQVCSFTNAEKSRIEEKKLCDAINFYLPKDIRIIKSKYLDFAFHPRFDAIAREYVYRIALSPSVFCRKYEHLVKYKLDFNLLEAAAKCFIGKKDFTSFSKQSEDVKNQICKVFDCGWSILSENRLELKIRANRFLYGMVRQCVGAMIDAARKKVSLEELSNRMALSDRKYCFPSAPAKGLFLKKVYYPNPIQEQLGF